MAQENDSGEKTEEPTSKRKDESRRDGMVGKSTDLSLVCGMTAAVVSMQHLAPLVWDDLIMVFELAFSTVPGPDSFEAAVMHQSFLALLWMVVPKVLLLMVITAFFGAGCTLLQTNFLWSTKLLKPKFKQLNPISGLKRLVSKQNILNVIKSLAKLCIIGPISYFTFVEVLPELIDLMHVPQADLLPYLGTSINYFFWRIATWLLVLALLDLAWQKWNNYQQMKMTKTEIKDERKSVEGDEQTKRQIQAKGLRRIRERMLKAVPTADVVVTNPTHYSIALRYDINKDNAPIVVAKGQDYLALRIREIAREANVPIVERKWLARTLYASVEPGQSIPYELYSAVAELLAYVYKLKNRRPNFRQAKSTN